MTHSSPFTKTMKTTIKKERISIDRITESIEVDVDFTQIYNCFSLLSFRLTSGTSFQLFFFILKNMDKDNIVSIDKDFKDSFFSLYKLVSGKKPVTEQSFYNALRDLINADVAKPLNGKKGRGTYFINPYAVWKSDKDQRISYLKEDAASGEAYAFNPMKLLEAPDSDRIIEETVSVEPYED